MKKIIDRAIDDLCKHLVRRYGSNDPFILAEALNIHVEYDELGTLKGYYCYMNRIRIIVINQNLDDRMRRLVCAHELGHDRLHCGMATQSPLCDTGFRSHAKHEIEANRFAAGLLVPDEELFEYASNGYSDAQIATALGTYPELVQIKVRSLWQSGVQVRLPDMPKSDFLKGI